MKSLIPTTILLGVALGGLLLTGCSKGMNPLISRVSEAPAAAPAAPTVYNYSSQVG